MASEPMTPRQIRGDALRRLGVRFKSGDSSDRRSDDLSKLDAQGVETVDLLEAVERIEITRQTTTYPPLAEILSRCRDARSARLAASRDLLPETALRRMNRGELDQCRGIAALYRTGLIWCGMCRQYRNHCEQHYRASYFGATPEQTAAALAALPAGKGQNHAAVKDPVTPGLTLVRDELGGMF